MSKTPDNKNSVRRLILNEAVMNHHTSKETLAFFSMFWIFFIWYRYWAWLWESNVHCSKGMVTEYDHEIWTIIYGRSSKFSGRRIYQRWQYSLVWICHKSKENYECIIHLMFMVFFVIDSSIFNTETIKNN